MCKVKIRPQRTHFYACNAGMGGNSIAQNLANKLGVQVWAPDNILWTWSSGKMFVGPRLSNQKSLPNGKPNPDYNKPDTSKPGGFQRFDPIPQKRIDSLIPRYSQ
ncbi:MAG: hypothetical protein ACR2II_12780 [Chthoniobacterales bacterium]